MPRGCSIFAQNLRWSIIIIWTILLTSGLILVYVLIILKAFSHRADRSIQVPTPTSDYSVVNYYK